MWRNNASKQFIANCHNLWFIERAFRMNKTDLRIRQSFFSDF